jgi:hypothetical protein
MVESGSPKFEDEFEKMLNKTKVVSSFVDNSLKTYVADKSILTGGGREKKRGTPENEGKSVDVHENKGQKIRLFRLEEILLKTNVLCDF